MAGDENEEASAARCCADKPSREVRGNGKIWLHGNNDFSAAHIVSMFSEFPAEFGPHLTSAPHELSPTWVATLSFVSCHVR